MHTLSLRAALLVASCLILPGQVLASTTTEAGTADAATAADQTTSANQAGQANDKNALTSSDIIVTGSRTAEAAPITASLTTTQPQAAVSREFIDSHVSASSDFNEIIALTPGVSITGTGNGAGFSESKATIRGFQDGEYNVTYDSIPFADTNNPTHHSTAFFPSNTIETVVVDRGPGNASQLGQATYGGNLNIYSRAVKDDMGGQIEAISGNWNTRILRGEFQTGKIASLGDAQFVLAGQYLESDGALTYSPVQSKNIFAKAVIPLGPDNTLTLLATYNRNHYYQSDTAKGVTCGSAVAGAGGLALGSDGLPLAQLTGENCSASSLIARYGKFYAMNNDPASTDYWKYNRTDKTTDFSIIRLQSNLGSGFSMDNRVYMYAYTNNTLSGQSGSVVTGFTTSNAGIISAVTDKTGHIQGYDKGNKYRTIGYIGQLNYEFLLGKIRLGGWYEHASTDRRLLDLDLTTGLPSYSEKFNNGSGTAAALALPASSLANVRYLQHSGWNQYQLFGEFEFHPTEGLSITPGVKYVHFTRSIDALVNQTARTPNQSSATWKKTLPFATVNWQLGSGFAVYGQYAQGMYVPDLSSFYSPSGSSAQQANQAKTLADLKPQTTTNYQVGAVWHGDKVSIDVDGYIINVNNKIAASTLATDPPNTLINIGQVRYRGVEGQISVMPLTGLTLFANASYNQAKSVTSGAQISKTPYTTSALGAFYNHNGFRMAYTQKFTGPQYATEFNGAAGPRKYRLAPYSVGDFSISQEIGEHFRIGITVANVFNSQAITAISNSALVTGTVGGTSYTSYGQSDAFSFLPPRSAQVDVRIKF
jgi:iron complex outermembrane receptor protein